MVNFEKSSPAPPCLEVEKAKPGSKNYRCGDVLERLRFDFKDKCYLCEQKSLTSINVEHLISHHQGEYRDLMFDWNNLFWACSRCNNIKLAAYDDILNCTDSEQLVDQWIKYEINPYPKEKAIFTALTTDERVVKTVELLGKIFNGHTSVKKIEAGNLRQELIRELQDFSMLLSSFYENEFNESLREDYKLKIAAELDSSSKFTAFKRWIIRGNEERNNDFGQFL